LKRKTLTQTAYETIRRSIVRGDYAPSEKLAIEPLKQMLGIGGSPVREALNQLAATDFVDASPCKGFSVAKFSSEYIQDIYQTRLLLEERALRLSMENADDEWEGKILAAFHLLSKLESNEKFLEKPNIEKWMQLYAAWHFAQLSRCTSPSLLKLIHQLFNDSERYRYSRLKQGVELACFKEMILDKHRVHEKKCKALLARDIQGTLVMHGEELNSTLVDLKKYVI
jgi:GntR family carbon starvation induced transcriptional regulator